MNNGNATKAVRNIVIEFQYHISYSEYLAFEADYDLDRPIGHGKTEAAAMVDLQEQLEELNEVVELQIVSRSNFSALSPSGW